MEASFLVYQTNPLWHQAGLDVVQRPLLAELLAKLHGSHDPRIVLALRPQDPLPDWVTHVAFVEGRKVGTTKRGYYTPHQLPNLQHESIVRAPRPSPRMDTREELLSLKDVHVQYEDRKVRLILPPVHIQLRSEGTQINQLDCLCWRPLASQRC